MAKYSAHERWKRNQAKKARRKSGHKSSLLDSLDYSKRARGQSKREYAAQQLGGKLDYKTGKITIRKKRSTPKLKDGIYDGYYVVGGKKYKTTYHDTGASPSPFFNKYAFTPNPLEKYTTKYLNSNNGAIYSGKDQNSSLDTSVLSRVKARKAKEKKSSEKSVSTRNLGNNVRRGLGINTAEASSGRPSPSTITQGRKKGWIERGMEIVKDPFGLEPKVRGLLTDKPWLKGVKGLLGYKANPIYQTEQGAGDAITQLLNGVTPEIGVSELFSGDTTGLFDQNDKPYVAGDNEPATNKPVFVDNIFNQPNPYGYKEDNQSRPSPTSIDNGAIYSGANQNSSLANYDNTPVVNTPSPVATTPSPIDNTPIQPNLGGIARKMASTGAFGNGALVSNRYDDATKEYIKRLQGSVKGDFGMDETKRQIENLLNSLNSRYGEYKRTGEKELSKAKEADLRKLAALFTAYNTTDSEQRMQQQERTQNDYQDRLADLIAKLDTQKSQDITDVKNKGLDAYSRIKQAQQSAQDKVAQLIYQAKQDAQNRAYQAQKDAWNRNYKQQQLASTNNRATVPNRLSHKEIFDWVNNAVANGGTWQEIADQAAAQGIDTSTGSYLDKLLNNVQKQNRWR